MESNSISLGHSTSVFRELQKNRFKSGGERPSSATWSVPSASFVRTLSSRSGLVILATGMDTIRLAEYWPRKPFLLRQTKDKFPELAQEGLAAWRVQKLYIRVSKADESSFAINTGQYIPLFGSSFQEIAALGYSFHRSQGNGDSYALPGEYDSFFRLAYPDAPHDSGFFDNLAVKLTDLPSLLEGESQKKQWLAEEIGLVEHMIREARQNFQPENFSGTVGPLLQGIVKLRKIQETLTQGFGNTGIKAPD